jgi:adenylate cyclase
VRHHAKVQRAKPAFFALLVLLPLMSAAGFVRMMRAVVVMHAILPTPDPKLVAHQLALDAWRHNLVAIYLALVITAFVAGQTRNWFERRRMRDS